MEARAASGRRARLAEWYGSTDYLRYEPRGEPVFGAGLTVDEAHMFSDDSYSDSLDALDALGFEYFPVGVQPGLRYIMRIADPTFLLAGADLAEQAVLLAAWVREAFDVLMRHPPYANRPHA